MAQLELAFIPRVQTKNHNFSPIYSTWWFNVYISTQLALEFFLLNIKYVSQNCSKKFQHDHPASCLSLNLFPTLTFSQSSSKSWSRLSLIQRPKARIKAHLRDTISNHQLIFLSSPVALVEDCLWIRIQYLRWRFVSVWFLPPTIFRL